MVFVVENIQVARTPSILYQAFSYPSLGYPVHLPCAIIAAFQIYKSVVPALHNTRLRLKIPAYSVKILPLHIYCGYGAVMSLYGMPDVASSGKIHEFFCVIHMV